jgi:hypothetical protein
VECPPVSGIHHAGRHAQVLFCSHMRLSLSVYLFVYLVSNGTAIAQKCKIMQCF